MRSASRPAGTASKNRARPYNAIVSPIAAGETPKLAAYSGATGTTDPNPSWLTAIRTHIQTRIR